METIPVRIHREALRDRVYNAYDLWSVDPKNIRTCNALGLAIREAAMFGVNIIVEIGEEALSSPESVDQEELEKAKWLNQDMKNEIVLSSDCYFLSNHNPISYVANVTPSSLRITVSFFGDKPKVFAQLKPQDIVSFNPFNYQER